MRQEELEDLIQEAGLEIVSIGLTLKSQDDCFTVKFADGLFLHVGDNVHITCCRMIVDKWPSNDSLLWPATIIDRSYKRPVVYALLSQENLACSVVRDDNAMRIYKKDLKKALLCLKRMLS